MANIDTINSDYYSDVVKLGESSELDTAIEEINKAILKMEEVKSLYASTLVNAEGWAGETRTSFNELRNFQKLYIDNLKPALISYKAAVSEIKKLDNSISSSKIIKKGEGI